MSSKPGVGQLSSLKVAQLKALAVACGLSNMGTKALLTQRLTDACTIPPDGAAGRKRRGAQRILSVDLGVRNLAVSLLSLSPSSSRSSSRRGSTASANAAGTSSRPAFRLHAWSRFAVVDSATEEAEGSGIWAPDSMAKLTLNLARDRLLAYKPTHILIERQRFRSGGMSAVQEWTLRVNTLEAMLHAVLRTLHQLGSWEGEVVSVPPSRHTSFWLGLEAPAAEQVPDRPKAKSRAAAKLRSKRVKIDLVGRWLREPGVQDWLRPGSKQTAEGYLHACSGKKRRPKEEGVESFDKLDDLADCLLQGAAWIRWEENKCTLARNGPDALLGQP